MPSLVRVYLMRAGIARIQNLGGALMGDKAKGKGKQLKKPKTDAKDKKTK
jgi:hypothetical protein